MRIQRLDITGFKSFSDRAVFSFSDGITGIVGPNGCGKSNVVDAVRWVMGEQSAKNLRGRGMEDVIFGGCESRQALNMAEVSLTFRSEDTDQLAPQYSGLPEITITRRLFRDGESEYLINKTPCRLLDITELFLGTGVGTRAYSIVEQGRVGLIVSAKAEDRRAFIEEAAGVTKYKARRKSAERKMEYTQQNLLRIADIVSELQKRLESLARQAKKADRYKKLKGQLREIELHAASHRFLEFCAQNKALQEKLVALSADEQQSLAVVRELQESIDLSRGQLEQDAQVIQSLQQRCHELESQIQLAAERLSHWAQDREAITKRLGEDESELSTLSGRGIELGSLIGDLEAQLQGLETQGKADQVAAEVAQEQLRRATQGQSDLQEKAGAERQAVVELVARLANCETGLVNLQRRREELEGAEAKRESELVTLRQQESVLEGGRREIARRLGEHRQSALELAERKGLEETSLNEARLLFAETEIQVISLREELGDKRGRLSSLEQIQRNYEGFDRGVRAVMLRAGVGSREAGVYGTVADIISAPPRFEKAIEAALGHRLQSVIVGDRAKAIELIEYLRSASQGRSSFVPLNLVGSEVELPSADFSRPGVLASAEAEVTCEEGFRPLVSSLLRGVVIMNDLDAARDYAANGGRCFTLVSLEGELLSSDGSVTGGASEGPASGALQKKREIGELSQQIAKSEEAYNEILTRHYALQKRILQAEGVLRGLAKTQHAEEINLATQEKDLHKLTEDLSRVRQQLQTAERERRELKEAAQAAAAEEEASRGELAQLQLERQQREEDLRRVGEELKALGQRAEAVSGELTALRVKLASAAERIDAARKELEQLGEQRTEVNARTARLEDNIRQSSARVEEITRSEQEATALRSEQAATLEALTGELEGRRAQHAESSSAVRIQDGRLRELRLRLDELGQGLSQLSLQERELALALEHLVEQIRDRHQLELSDELHRFHLSPPLPADHEHRLDELRAQVERLGEINLTAIEEHAEVSTRCQFLSGQQKDLESSLERLKQAIARIDRTSREKFKKTFELIDGRFQQVFPRLFGGGRAALLLTEVEGGGEPGVEIVAQPPGKKLQNVNLLSGGEKALTAVSLLFAIFLTKPTPFCILDEVDAPLDEANVGRYNDLVREISRLSQFIIITHNKRTMEVLDTLYGVTMEEPGISKLVSVTFKDATAGSESQAA